MKDLRPIDGNGHIPDEDIPDGDLCGECTRELLQAERALAAAIEMQRQVFVLAEQFGVSREQLVEMAGVTSTAEGLVA